MTANEKYITAGEQAAALENYAILADQMVGEGSEVVQANGVYMPSQDECYLIADPDARWELTTRDIIDYQPRWLLSSMPAIYLNDEKLFQLAPNHEPIDIHTFLTEGSLEIHDNDYYSQYEDDDYQRLKRYLEIGQLLIMTIGGSTTNHRKYFRILSLYMYNDKYEIRVSDGAHMYDDGHLSSGAAWMFVFDFSNDTVTYYFEEV